MAMISSDVLATYAADAAREVEGVRELVESTLHRHRGVRVLESTQECPRRSHVTVRRPWNTVPLAFGSAPPPTMVYATTSVCRR